MNKQELASGEIFSEPDRGKAFAELVHRLLMGRDKSELDKISDEMGMSYSAFYNRLRHATPFSADEIQRLLIVVKDPAIADFLLSGTPYIPAERHVGPEDATFEESIARGAERIVLEAADVLRAAHEALIDDHIDHREEITIRQAIREAERALLSLRGHLDALR